MLLAFTEITYCLEIVLLEALRPQSVKAGKSVAFTCFLAEGRSATFTWSKDGFLLGENDRIQILNTRKSSVLNINDVENSDRGSYTCIASNDNAEHRTSARLTVDGI